MKGVMSICASYSQVAFRRPRQQYGYLWPTTLGEFANKGGFTGLSLSGCSQGFIESPQSWLQLDEFRTLVGFSPKRSHAVGHLHVGPASFDEERSSSCHREDSGRRMVIITSIMHMSRSKSVCKSIQEGYQYN